VIVRRRTALSSYWAVTLDLYTQRTRAREIDSPCDFSISETRIRNTIFDCLQRSEIGVDRHAALDVCGLDAAELSRSALAESHVRFCERGGAIPLRDSPCDPVPKGQRKEGAAPSPRDHEQAEA